MKQLCNSNTTLVKVKSIGTLDKVEHGKNSNTTLVKVKLCKTIAVKHRERYSNTTLVKVKFQNHGLYQ